MFYVKKCFCALLWPS